VFCYSNSLKYLSCEICGNLRPVPAASSYLGARRARLTAFVLTFSFVLTSTTPIEAQIQNGTVIGAVSDPTGALVANAVMSLRY
jgi:hypothetical protein